VAWRLVKIERHVAAASRTGAVAYMWLNGLAARHPLNGCGEDARSRRWRLAWRWRREQAKPANGVCNAMHRRHPSEANPVIVKPQSASEMAAGGGAALRIIAALLTFWLVVAWRRRWRGKQHQPSMAAIRQKWRNG
jgi:hypothetical protein